MGQKHTKVTPITEDERPSTPPGPSTSAAAQHPHPRDETPAGAGGGEEEQARKEAWRAEEPRKRKGWWRRMTSFFRAARKRRDLQGSSSRQQQQQQQEEGEKRKVAWAERSSDDYIFSRYSVGDRLGKGASGEVFEGRRLDDDLAVALKYVSKTQHTACMFIPDHPNPLPKEIALTILANKGPSVPEIVRLLDWQDHPDHFVLVLERPSPCETLLDFAGRHGGSLDEETTREIMRRAARAANTCCLRGVLHRDITLRNLLIDRETLDIKLIDFGCGDVLRRSPYRSFCGTAAYAPPEYRRRGRYYGRPATVWSLGVVMFTLLCGRFPSGHDLSTLKSRSWSKPGLSEDCCHLLRALLHPRQSGRLGLGRIEAHNWFKVAA